MSDTETVLKTEHREETQKIIAFVDTLGDDDRRLLLAMIRGYSLGLADRQQAV